MEAQRGTDGGVKGADGSVNFSPQFKALKVEEDLKAQVMALSGGNTQEYNSIMSGSVEVYLRKFEHHIKSNAHGEGTNRIRG